MFKPESFRAALLIAIVAAFMIFCISALTGAMGRRPVPSPRPDMIVIDIPPVAGYDSMPGVRFLHEPHNEAAEGDCAACHMNEEGTPVFRFKRLTDPDGETLMNLFHENCTACHVEKKRAGLKTGPEAGECRVCHNTGAMVEPGRQAVVFDRSLHFRHEQSEEIKPADGPDKTNCGACHHQYNPKTLDIYYEKGREGACLYCHKAEAVDGIRSMRQASHDACVACHKTLEQKEIAAGPVTCKACHGQGAFKDVVSIPDVPRLKRNQPDAGFISGWGAMYLTAKESEGLEKKFMNPVPFDHQSHEAAIGACRTCHHESLDKCGKCHTPEGAEKGGYIRLDQAMHTAGSASSCLGCHDRRKEDPSCAGCHFQMPEKDFADNACAKCHYRDFPAAALFIMDAADQKDMARSALAGLIDGFKPVADEKIPETVTIGVIAREYEPSIFPHRKIVRSIMEKIKDSDLAAVFHGDGRTLCMGCHHNSPLSDEPPGCASCHGQSTFTRDGRPGLKGAYHGQCITCHQQMNIEAVAATDCVACHQEKRP